MAEFERIRTLVHEIAGVPVELVTPEATADQLKLDSLDIADIILSLEDEYGVLVEDDSSIRCVRDLMAVVGLTA